MAEENSNNVDQIRDLIFGNQIKDFEKQFNEYNNKLQMVEKKLLKEFTEVHAKLQKETERSLEVIEKKIDNLSHASAKERLTLKELIDTIDESMQDRLKDQKDEYSAKFEMIKMNTSDANKKIIDDVKTFKTQIQTTLEESLLSLSEDKISRDSMAQMFLEIAMKIQNTDITTLVNESKGNDK